MAHHGGTKVNYGFYWSAKAWDMAMVPAEGGLLPGGSDRHYTRIPTVLFLLMAPLMGALYVVFLPVAGFALVGGHALRAAKTLAMDSFMHIAVAVSPTGRPAKRTWRTASAPRPSRRRSGSGPRRRTTNNPGSACPERAPPSRASRRKDPGLHGVNARGRGPCHSSGGAGGRIPDGGPGS